MNIVALPPDAPALNPPPGFTSNFDNPAGVQGKIHTTLIFCLVISTVSVWSRLYARFFIQKTHGWDDCKITSIPNVSTDIGLIFGRYIVHCVGMWSPLT